MTKFDKLAKFSFDLFFSIAGLIITFPFIVTAWIFASIETKSNGFFTQIRIGKNGKLFKIVKIKTMKRVEGFSSTVTTSNDKRITFTGAFFRKTKIDELPQLFNVLLGHMSFVGPRPDVPGYADKLSNADMIILSVRPGITGPAQLLYNNEEDLLANQDNPIRYNDEVIWPHKVKINRKYVEHYSFVADIHYIWKTIIG
jgi:lipopolysaccharide/colanic/teichoic acid biosynthesis glycosyltransferase